MAGYTRPTDEMERTRVTPVAPIMTVSTRRTARVSTFCGAGLGTINGDDDLFYRNAVMLCDADVRRKMGENSRKLLRRTFSVERAGDQILSSLGSGGVGLSTGGAEGAQ